MGLRADRIHIDSQIDFFMNEEAERGGVVAYSTVGSGAAMDQAEQLCTYAASMSGVAPIGVLMCDVVDNDLTRVHENWHKEEVQKGGKVTIWSKGTVVTNRVVSPASVTAGALAYIGPSGFFTLAPGATQTQETGTLLDKYVVGRFQSKADENGYVKVAVNLP